MKYFIYAAAFGLLISCSSQSEDYVFRNDDRPVYAKTMNVQEFEALERSDVTLIDVRLAEDFAKQPDLIEGAIYHDPEAITTWASQIPKDKPVVVYCVKGKWVSQKAATYLSAQGYDVYSLDGGINGWSAAASK